MSGSTPGAPDRGGVTGNTFDGPAAAQTGAGSTQVNNFHAPPPKQGHTVAVAIVGALVLIIGTSIAIKLATSGNSPHGPARAASAPAGDASAPPSLSSTAPVSSSRSEAPAPAASLPQTSDTARWTATVRIAESGPRLDQNPPTLDRYQWDVQLGMVDPPRISSQVNTTDLAVWPGPGMPTRQDCLQRVSTQGQFQVVVKVGTIVCVKTQGGRIAVLTITSVSDNFNTGLEAQATVWSQVSDQN